MDYCRTHNTKHSSVEECPDCKSARKSAFESHKASHQEAVFMSDKLGLPALTSGSTKQVAWANEIRVKMVSGSTRLLEFVRSASPNFMLDAKWWIDHRMSYPADIEAKFL